MCLYTVHICTVCACILYIYVQYVPVYCTYMYSMCLYTLHICAVCACILYIYIQYVPVYCIYTAVQFSKADAYESRYMSGYMYIGCSHNSNKTTLLCKQPILYIEMVTTICVGKCWCYWLLMANGYTFRVYNYC